MRPVPALVWVGRRLRALPPPTVTLTAALRKPSRSGQSARRGQALGHWLTLFLTLIVVAAAVAT